MPTLLERGLELTELKIFVIREVEYNYFNPRGRSACELSVPQSMSFAGRNFILNMYILRYLYPSHAKTSLYFRFLKGVTDRPIVTPYQTHAKPCSVTPESRATILLRHRFFILAPIPGQ